MNMKEKLLEMGYQIWTKKEGEERIYINNLIDFLTVTKTENSAKDTIDIRQDTIEDIRLGSFSLSKASKIKSALVLNSIKFYYNTKEDKFCWKSDCEELDTLLRIVIKKLRAKLDEKEIAINVNNAKIFISEQCYQKEQIITYNKKQIKILKVEKIFLSKDDVEHIYGGCFVDHEEDYNILKNSFRYTYIEL